MSGPEWIRRRCSAVALVAAAAVLAPVPSAATAAPGDVDPGWNGGTALTRYRPSGVPDASLTGVLIDGQGRVVGTGFSQGSQTDGLLARLKPDGTPDETFDGDGYATVQYDTSGTPVTTGRGVLRDPNGRLGGGWATTAQHSARIARYAENGALDPTYGTAGLASVSAFQGEDLDGPFANALRNVLPTANGSTLAVIDGGRAGSGPFFWQNRAWVARLDPNGDPDPGYGTGGRASNGAQAPNAGRGVGIASGVADPAGRVLVVGNTVIGGNSSTGKEAAIVYRFTASGQVDTTFGGGDGKVEFQAGLGSSPYSYGSSVAVAPDGSVYVGGSASTGVPADEATAFVAKLSPAGVLDATFGARQVPAVSAGASWTGLRGVTVLVQGDGKPVLVGSGTSGGSAPPSPFVARYDQFGNPDTTFKGDGVATFALSYGAKPLAAALTKYGKDVVIVGTSYDSGTQAFATRVNLRDPSEIHVPVNATPPTLAGSPVPGSTLTCQPGTWQNSPTTVDVVWERAPRATASPDDPAWAPVAGTTATTYVVQPADLGSRLRCREVATNGDGSDTAPSGSKRVDAGGPLNSVRPSYVGVPVVGEKLTCAPGTWTGGPDLTYRWVRDGGEISGATSSTYTVAGGDRGRQLRCRVYAANDVGGNVADSDPQLAVGAPPANTARPVTVLTRTGPKATDITLSCSPGRWDEDYGNHDYAWQREGADIAGATGGTYRVTLDDLGQNLACVEFSTNPAGRSEGAAGSPVLVPLPATGERGQIFQAGGANSLDPVNMIALSGGFLRAAQGLALQRRADATARQRQACNSGIGRAAQPPSFGGVAKTYTGVVIGGQSLCGVLRNAPADQIVQTNQGTFWRGGTCRLPDSFATFATRNAPYCPGLDITIQPLDPTAPSSALAELEQATLAPLRPLKVLWDVNRDGRTDATCGADAPILRSLYERGHYDVRAVVISADSEQTGLYSIADLPLDVFSQNASQRGSLRKAQVFACRTQLQPPATRAQPCVREATIGRAHVLGNLCPINERQIPESELTTLPPSVQEVLRQQSINRGLRRAPPRDPGGLGSIRTVAPGAPAFDVTAQLSALSTLGSGGKFKVATSWAGNLRNLSGFVSDKASFALDQIYQAQGTATVNGISVVPGKDASVVLVPSDAGEAIKDIKKMTIASSQAQTLLGGLPIGNPEKLSTDLLDRVDVPAPPLKGANLDALADALKKKLDLGPFNLAGDAKVRLADDGSAFIDAYAELPSLSAGPGARPIRTAVTVHGTREGKVTLEGIHITAPQAYLGALKIRDLALDWDGSGLSVVGKLLFPPIDQGISINRFRIDGDGNFKELDVDYLAGAGQGINVGPGVFLVKLGGGLSLDPDEIRGRAGFSVGPSTGGGCPTAGIDADFNVHWSPAPWFVDAKGTVRLVCIDVGDATFHADQTGLIDLASKVKLDIGPIYAEGGVHGTMRLPRWQLDIRGEGGIRHVLNAEVRGLVSNLGLAACGRMEVFPETPVNDAVYIAAGAGVHFSGGRPPFTYAELLANIDGFAGCDLTGWSPFGRGRAVIGSRATAHGAAAAGSSFTIAKPAPAAVPLQLVGAGGAPRVRLRTPSGKVIDASGVGEDFTRSADVSGLRDEAHSRTVLFVRGEAGTWAVEPAEGSPAIVDIRRSSVLPAPKVTAKVSGRGADRKLTYRVTRIAGQEVRFVEQSRGGLRDIALVRNGGSGSKRFVTSEGKGTKRTVVAEISQGGLPRDRITVARFSAPPPTAGTPKVRTRRSGSRLTVTWSAARHAARYEVTIETGTGRRLSLTPAGRRRSVRVGGFKRGEGASVRVVALTEAGRRGRPGTARAKGTLRYRTVKAKKRKLVVPQHRKPAKKQRS